MALDIKIIKKRDYVYTVELEGSLDTETYIQLEDELKEILSESTKAIVFDMKGVSYISSAGIGVVMSTKKTLTSRGASFAMTNLQPQITKVFDAMKVLSAIDVLDDMTEVDQYIDQIIKDETQKQSK